MFKARKLFLNIQRARILYGQEDCNIDIINVYVQLSFWKQNKIYIVI